MDRSTVPVAMTDADVVAFLHGQYVEHCLSHGDAVPAWAWLNLLAHGTTDQLGHDSLAGRSGDQWHQARALIADEILEHVERRRVPLESFQRDVLVPLELDSIACRTTARWTPGGFASGLLTLLSGRPRTARDPCRCPRCALRSPSTPRAPFTSSPARTA